jgi:hypothetical protein
MLRKILLCFFAFLLVSSIYADTEVEKQLPTTEDQESSELISSESSPKEFGSIKYTVIPYAQLVAVFPGAGVAFRSQQEYVGVQIDAGWALVVGYPLVKVSSSLIVYLSPKKGEEWRKGGWNIGFGLGSGVLAVENSWQPFIYFPISMGYQGKRLFFDGNIDVVRSIHEKLIVPSIKVGYCF